MERIRMFPNILKKAENFTFLFGNSTAHYCNCSQRTTLKGIHPAAPPRLQHYIHLFHNDFPPWQAHLLHQAGTRQRRESRASPVRSRALGALLHHPAHRGAAAAAAKRSQRCFSSSASTERFSVRASHLPSVHSVFGRRKADQRSWEQAAEIMEGELNKGLLLP